MRTRPVWAVFECRGARGCALRTASIHGPELFEQASQVLHQEWQRLEQLVAPVHNAAVDALMHAEQRKHPGRADRP